MCRKLKILIFIFILVIQTGLMIPSTIKAQYWSNLPPYNALWPLFLPELSPPDPVTGLPTPIVTKLTVSTILEKQPGLAWDPSRDDPWLLYNFPYGILIYYDESEGFNPWPPPYLIDPGTGLPSPIALPIGWSALPPSPTMWTWLTTIIPLANEAYDLYISNFSKINIYYVGKNQGDFPTIQAAIDSDFIEDGDTVIIRDGTYRGEGNRDIDFKGKAITVRSENRGKAIIDCEQAGRGFHFHRNETNLSVLDGVTIRNGRIEGSGTGICCESSSPTIMNCVIEHNTALGYESIIGGETVSFSVFGGGIYCSSSSAIIKNCTISDNSAQGEGGGIYCSSSSAKIINCVIKNNHVTKYGGSILSKDGSGGGITCYGSDEIPKIINSKIADNEADGYGGGISCTSSSPEITNCVIKGNKAQISSCFCLLPPCPPCPKGYGGGVYALNSSCIITNCTFIDNSALYNHSGWLFVSKVEEGHGIYSSSSSDSQKPVIRNCIVWDYNEEIGYGGSEISYKDFGAPKVEYCNIYHPYGTVYPGTGNRSVDPLFKTDPIDEFDYRLEETSPCIDQGKNMNMDESPPIHSDIRDSIRPYDGKTDGTGDDNVFNNFDMGAFEFAQMYEPDGIKAFKDLKVVASIIITNQEYEIQWKLNKLYKKDMMDIYFPRNDKRYDIHNHSLVRLAALLDNGIERYLTQNPIKVPIGTVSGGSIEEGWAQVNTGVTPDETYYSYTYSFDDTYKDKEIRLRIELDADRQQYTESDDLIGVTSIQPKKWIIGQRVIPEPPQGLGITIDETKKPTFDEELFLWSESFNKLYAIAPTVNVVVIIWTDTDGNPYPETGQNIKKDPQLYVSDIEEPHVVDLLPEGSGYQVVEMVYSDPEVGATLDTNKKFAATGEGISVFAYYEVNKMESEPIFEVVETIEWNNESYREIKDWIIGEEIYDQEHDPDCGSGYIFFEFARYDKEIYDRQTRTGPIFSVNEDDPYNPLVVVWYKKSKLYENSKVCWPFRPVQYVNHWPQDPEVIIIASGLGSTPLSGDWINEKIYYENYPTQPGYNPNEEHALITDEQVYAVRCDLNNLPEGAKTSEPYVLLRYQDSQDDNKWKYKVYQVIAETEEYPFHYIKTAGDQMAPPTPLENEFLPLCGDSFPDRNIPLDHPWWECKRDLVWAKKAGEGGIYFYYRLNRESYYYPDLDGDGEPDYKSGVNGDCVPWLDLYAGTPGIPKRIAYTIKWPEDPSELRIGQTVVKKGEGLPEIENNCSVEIIYDQSKEENNKPSVKLIDYRSEAGRYYPLEGIGSPGAQDDLEGLYETRYIDGRVRWIFPDIPKYLRDRFTYDPVDQELKFKGICEMVGSIPNIRINVITNRELYDLKTLTENVEYNLAISYLKQITQSNLEGKTELVEKWKPKALTAGDAQGTGYVTLAIDNNAEACPEDTKLKIIKVIPKLYVGRINIINPDSVFDSRVTYRHNADFAGKLDDLTFQWLYTTRDPNIIGRPVGDDIPEGWNYWAPKQKDPNPDVNPNKSAIDITIDGPGPHIFTDKWIVCRYKGYRVDDGSEIDEETWSDWTDPVQYYNWIKRIRDEIGLFEQRCKDYHAGDQASTVVDMISQAGSRFEGDVALTEYNIDESGLIEFYETVLRVGKKMTIDYGIDNINANKALLTAASYISNLYMLLGNEAYTDALDPTIGFGTDHGDYGKFASSVFCWQGQVSSLLEEELILLRGRDDTGGPVNDPPFYNRLKPNLILGDEGEVAYVMNYNIIDKDGDNDLYEEALAMFPQGQGDAWGHYLTAITTYYTLLRHKYYTWEPQVEEIPLGSNETAYVDFREERKFAKVAAARARCGTDIMNLTYRYYYVDDPEEQWQGYKDEDPDRAWGVAEWACRAGEGAYLDWVVGNALLPPIDTNPDHNYSIEKIDRKTVIELREIPDCHYEIQAILDRANAGLNPLGVAKGGIPFDIDPAKLKEGITHFEQSYQKALQALNNAIVVFNYANGQSQLLRKQQDSYIDFQNNIENERANFENQLIQIFGTPYDRDPEYPPNAYEPDMMHYNYIDPVTGPGLISSIHTVKVPLINFEYIYPNDGTSSLEETESYVNFHLSDDYSILVKPEEWGERKVYGEIQISLMVLLQGIAKFKEALKRYNNCLEDIRDQVEVLISRKGLMEDELTILNDITDTVKSENDEIKDAREYAIGFRNASIANDKLCYASSVAISKDPYAYGRSGTLGAGALITIGLNVAADIYTLKELDALQAKEETQHNQKLNLKIAEKGVQDTAITAQIEQLIRNESTLRHELYTLQEVLRQSEARYLAAIASGWRLEKSRIRFEQQVAERIQNYRYKDMAFRIFRNQALQKYRDQFDLAARYVYLSAKAYDYETCLLDSESNSGQIFLTNIVKERTIGQIFNERPVFGLAGILADLKDEFSGIKGYLRFNNPQTELYTFSLRKELFRIDSLDAWRDELERHRVDNLWDLPEFRRYCVPFYPDEDIPQPAIVIPFETTITSGLNFFKRWTAGAGDSVFNPTNFATKIQNVGIYFIGYSDTVFMKTPYVYLIPVGIDIMSVPNFYTWIPFEIRDFEVVDQILPGLRQLQIGGGWEDNSTWIPSVNTLESEGLFRIRRHGMFRAYQSKDYLKMTYDSRLIGRSVWNTRWLLIIPGAYLLGEDPLEGVTRFIYGTIDFTGNRDPSDAVTDIILCINSYAYAQF